MEFKRRGPARLGRRAGNGDVSRKSDQCSIPNSEFSSEGASIPDAVSRSGENWELSNDQISSDLRKAKLHEAHRAPGQPRAAKDLTSLFQAVVRQARGYAREGEGQRRSIRQADLQLVRLED